MAGADGRHRAPLRAVFWRASDIASLSERLAREPYRFDFRQAVRLLELEAHRQAASVKPEQPDRIPVGEGTDPRRESVQLRGSLTSSFPPSDIELLISAGPDDRPALTATFFGIGGAFGPLPPPLTSHVVERERVRDHAGRDFLDLFNHRLLSLLLRHWRLCQPALQVTPGVDAPAKMPLLALLGLATLPRDGSSASVSGRLGGITKSLLGTAGLLNQRPVSAHALQRVLAAHFGLPVRILPLRGGWLQLADDQLSRLGRVGQLGNAVLGGRIWDQAAGVRIDIGPTGLDRLLSLLPGHAGHDELVALVEFALGDAFDVELRLLLRPEEVPAVSFDARGARLGSARLGAVRLAQQSRTQPGPRLGWTSWLGQQPRRVVATVRLRIGARHAEMPDA